MSESAKTDWAGLMFFTLIRRIQNTTMAFHSILEHVETLGLAEGEYLSVVNSLKKAFQDTNKGKYTITHIPINLSLDYINGDKRTIVNITKMTYMEYVRKEGELGHHPPKYIYTFTLHTPDGKTETMSIAKEDVLFFTFLRHIGRVSMPMQFVIRHESGRVDEFSYADHVRNFQQITTIHDEDEDCDGEWDPLAHDRFLWRITDIFDDVIMWEVRKYMAARKE